MLTQAERKAKEEKINDLITRSEEIINKAKEETRELTEEEATMITEIRDDVKAMKTVLMGDDAEREIEEMKEKEEVSEEEENVEETRAVDVEVMERNAFENYIRGKVVNERSGELSPASGSGEKIIPTSIANQIIKTVYDICPILEKSQKFNVKGTLEIPTYGETSSHDNITVAFASEFSDLASHSGAFNTVSLTGFLAGALTKISRSLINNAQFNVVDFVVNEMAVAIKRFIEKELLDPSDASNKVVGMSNLTNILTAQSASAITADEVIQLRDKVKDIYQNDAMWIMSPATRTALRLLKDSMGRYLLQDDVTAPFGTTLLGKPVYVSDNMPNIATGNMAIYYGDFKGLATKFSEEINVEVLREVYAPQHAVACVAWMEFDGKVCDNQKLAGLQMA